MLFAQYATTTSLFFTPTNSHTKRYHLTFALQSSTTHLVGIYDTEPNYCHILEPRQYLTVDYTLKAHNYRLANRYHVERVVPPILPRL